MEAWTNTKVLKKGIKIEDVKSILQPLEIKNNIKQEKKEDLKKMIPFLKEESKDFYKELID